MTTTRPAFLFFTAALAASLALSGCQSDDVPGGGGSSSGAASSGGASSGGASSSGASSSGASSSGSSSRASSSSSSSGSDVQPKLTPEKDAFAKQLKEVLTKAATLKKEAFIAEFTPADAPKADSKLGYDPLKAGWMHLIDGQLKRNAAEKAKLAKNGLWSRSAGPGRRWPRRCSTSSRRTCRSS